MSESLYQQIEGARPTLAGWCTPDKARKLADLVLDNRPALAVEIGTFGASSLCPIALAMKSIGHGMTVGVDPWTREACLEDMVEPANLSWWGKLDIEAIYRGAVTAIDRLGLKDFCRLIRARSEDAVNEFDDGSIGLLHIDGNHSEEPAYRDVVLYLPKVVSGGFIVCDDIDWCENGHFTLRKALDYLRANGCREVDTMGNCMILRKSEARNIYRVSDIAEAATDDKVLSL